MSKKNKKADQVMPEFEKNINELIAENIDLRNRNGQLIDLVEIICDDIRKIYASWSWRITSPFRGIINIFTLGHFEGDIPVYLKEGNPYEYLLVKEKRIIRTSGSKQKNKNKFESILENYDSEPWDIPLKKRIDKLKTDIAAEKQIVIHFYDYADSSTFRYTCYNVSQYAIHSEIYGVHYFFADECDTVANYLDKISILVLCRTKWTIKYENLIKKAREKNIRVVMQIDDLVCNMKYINYLLKTNLDAKGSDYIYDSWFANVIRLECTAKEAEEFIVTNDFLGAQLKETFNKNYRVIRNSLNSEQISVSKELLEAGCKEKTGKEFVIGYFSGSPTHKNDLGMIIPEIQRLLTDYGDIVFEIVGYMELPRYLKKYITEKRIRFKPLTDFINLQYIISQVDVNLVPLEDNLFNNCKSELKFFEAAAVETITVASPTYVYKNAIEDKIDGFLCEKGEWYQTIADIHDGKYDVKAMAKRAKEKALSVYAGNALVEEIETAYTALIGV